MAGKSTSVLCPVFHLEEQKVGQLSDVLVIRDAVVLEDVTEVPEFDDGVVGDVARVVNPWPAGRGTARR
jgi:hypothetical protein